MAELQATFGDNVRARIVPGVVDGKKSLLVVLRYTSYRAVAGPLDAGLTKEVGRRVRDRGFVAKLRGAGSADALYALFAGGESRDAA